MTKGVQEDHQDSINPLNESEGPNFFILASRRLREIGFKFSTERDTNLVHFTKTVYKPETQ